MRVGVLGALPEEVAAVTGQLADTHATTVGDRTYTVGTCAGHQLVTAHARIGKVAAAAAAVELISRFGVDQLIFTGLAGALSPHLGPGDVVIAEGLTQHDLDASPLFPPLEVPLTGRSRFIADPAIADRLHAAAEHAAANATGQTRQPRVFRGDIATGDQFVSDAARRADVLARVPDALCVEMEGAAVAQVCTEYRVPFGVVRLISDSADESAADDFLAALQTRAADLAGSLVTHYVRGL